MRLGFGNLNTTEMEKSVEIVTDHVKKMLH
jgi:hypothetical protein